MPNKHWLRYGTPAEQKHFDLKEYYDGVAINGNMVAYSPKALGGFVVALRKPFFIDPQTHAFQHEIETVLNDSGVPKASIANLAKYYGTEDVLSQKKALGPSDLASPEKKNDFVGKVIDFQTNIFQEKILASEDGKYVEFAISNGGGKVATEIFQPSFVIPPYFYLDLTNFDSWLPMNIELAMVAAAKFPKLEMAAQLVLDKSVLLDKEKCKKIVEAYSKISIKRILLWVDAFAEDEAEESELSAFIDLVQSLALKSKEVYNVYGGYFSILLTKIENGLAGVSHGLEYGESRAVVPVGGGIPMAKYYYPPIHKRIKYPELVKILLSKNWMDGANNSDFHDQVCACKQCRNIPQFGESFPVRRGKVTLYYPTQAAKNHSLRHYLINKKKEFEFLSSDWEKVLGQLASANKEYSGLLGPAEVGHLGRWSRAISRAVGAREEASS